ncbi:SDR family oxidoreductase [Nocardioides sp. SR21]|uniref:SDR family NAD(P)-dependent oxidoreductase n=1 Tax=Nocardioides sp. SR21 TaxID=2919501 RepID=UPI001FAA4C0A|nr:SDR family NAD(P)-dependent oxidoreductase [Nocardioides sp. SR21]
MKYWIIGASSGIGAELAQELVRRGGEVAISARKAEDLQEVAGDAMQVVPLDATDRAAVLAASEQVGDVDVVVWCAGYWKQFDAAAWDADIFERHIEVNLLGLNNVLAAAIPRMVRNRRGHLVGIASVAGYRGLPGAEAYGATKAAQINLLEGLRAALSKHGVRVTTVCPGFVRTPMTDTNEFPMPFMIEADQAARAIADGLEKHRTEIVFPLPMAVTMKLARLVPVRAWAALTKQR